MDNNGMLPKHACKKCGSELGKNVAELYAGTYTGLCYECERADPYIQTRYICGANEWNFPPHAPSWRRDRETFVGYPDCPHCGGRGRVMIMRSFSRGGDYPVWCNTCKERYYRYPPRMYAEGLHTLRMDSLATKRAEIDKSFRNRLVELGLAEWVYTGKAKNPKPGSKGWVFQNTPKTPILKNQEHCREVAGEEWWAENMVAYENLNSVIQESYKAMQSNFVLNDGEALDGVDPVFMVRCIDNSCNPLHVTTGNYYKARRLEDGSLSLTGDLFTLVQFPSKHFEVVGGDWNFCYYPNLPYDDMHAKGVLEYREYKSGMESNTVFANMESVMYAASFVHRKKSVISYAVWTYNIGKERKTVDLLKVS